MRWPWQRRKDPQSAPEQRQATSLAARALAPRTGPARHATATQAPRDPMLAFARDVLELRGATVRSEDAQLVVATLPDGSEVRYTTSAAYAHADAQSTLLMTGTAELAALRESAAAHARGSALRLATEADAVALALAACADPAPSCGRCLAVGQTQPGTPACEVCPLREGRLVLRWPDARRVATALHAREEQAVEVLYLVTTVDRRGRREEAVRLAFAADGTRREPVPVEVLARAEAATPPPEARATAERVLAAAEAALRPALEAAALFAQQRTAEEFRRRLEDVTQTHERLRSESPELGREITAALEREVAALRAVYSLELDVRVEALSFVATSVARVRVACPTGAALELDVDLGRQHVRPPQCAACGGEVAAGGVCAESHVTCAACQESCTGCGAWRCPQCATAPYATCRTCGGAVCPTCVHHCARCGTAACAEHLWHATDTDQQVCLACLEVCTECEVVLADPRAPRCSGCRGVVCAAHAATCSVCGDVRCPRHLTRCATCGVAQCSEHATTCARCGSTACAAHTFACAGCGLRLCGCAAPATCRVCRERYCSTCLEDERCPACRALGEVDAPARAALTTAAASDSTIPLGAQWQAGRNAGTYTFVTRRRGRTLVVVVTHEGTLVRMHRKGWLERV